MPLFGFSSTFKGHLLLARDCVPRETFGFVAPQFTDGRYLLAPDDLPLMTFVPLLYRSKLRSTACNR